MTTKGSRPKRFYLASAFDLVRQVQRIADDLDALGHVVPVRWWDIEGEAHKAKTAPISEHQFYHSPAVQATAARDFGGVATCDALMCSRAGGSSRASSSTALTKRPSCAGPSPRSTRT